MRTFFKGWVARAVYTPSPGRGLFGGTPVKSRWWDRCADDTLMLLCSTAVVDDNDEDEDVDVGVLFVL